MNSKPKKRIILLSPFFYPENISTGKYNTSLVEALAENNIDMSVICSHPLYPSWQPSPTTETLLDVHIQRGGQRIFYPKQVILRRFVLEIWFAFHSFIQVLKIRNEVDTIIAVFPPTLFMIFLPIILPKKVKTIGIIHDLLGIMATSRKGKFRTLISRLIRYGEISAFKSCDKLICLSESMKDTVNQTYGIPNSKLVVQYPFVSTKNGNTKTSRLDDIFPKNYKHIVYSGALGEKQIPTTLLAFYEKLCASNKQVMCHIFSRGPMFNQLQSTQNNKFPDRILFHDLVDEKDLPELYEQSEIQVIPQATGTGAGAFPSKLPNLLAAGVPVFVICDKDSELGKITETSGIGHVVKDWNMDQWVSDFNRLLTKVKKETHHDRKKRTEKLILEKFSVQSLVNTILR